MSLGRTTTGDPDYRSTSELFSARYLDEYLPSTDRWAAADRSAVRAARARVRACYREWTADEDPTERRDRLVEPALEALDLRDALDRLPADSGPASPDYAPADAAASPAVVVASPGELDAGDTEGFWTPVRRMRAAFDATGAEFGVLTTGDRWRLYRRSDPDAYYEIDLPALLAAADPEAFRYFYLFFGRRGVAPAGDREPFAAWVADRSDAYVESVAADLRANAADAAVALADGLLDGADPDALGPGDADRLREAAVTYLLRLLCLLFAGGSDADALTGRLRAIADSDGERARWDRLADLFARVDAGRADGLPSYDGRLFDAPPGGTGADVLDAHRASDATLARVLDLLTRRERADGTREPVDYAALSVRHLGGVYERLLACGVDIECGEARPAPDADRAATGAYYTTDPLASHVVERTLEPLVDEVRADVDWSRADAAERFARGVYALDVADPAMGSGRFLLAVVDHLADAVAAGYRRQAERAGPETLGDAPDRDEIRGRVAERCVHGVDADTLAVEVARASLWLRTLPATEPPALGDLRAGDSLVGDRVADIEELEGVYRRLTEGSSESARLRERLRAAADVRTAERFGVDVPDGTLDRLGRAVDDPEGWAALRDEPWFREAREVAAERDALHWDLAFPGVFAGPDPGFDAVVGNPPYVRSRDLPPDRKAYCRRAYRTAEGAYDLYVPFVELAGSLGERVSLVVPNKWTTTDYGRPLRDLLLDDYRLCELLDASGLDAFADADVYPVVVTFERGDSDADTGVRVRHAGGDRPLSTAPTTTVPRSLVDRLGGRVLPLDADAGFAAGLADALDGCDRLGDHVTLGEGVHTGNVREKLLADAPSEGARRKVVGGGEVSRYRLDWEGSWLRCDRSLVRRERGEYADLREPGLFDGEKLLLRDISDRPVAVYDDEGYYALNTLYSVRSRPESALSLRYLLAVLNSAFAARYFRQLYGGTGVAGDYLRCKPMFVADFPVPDPDPGAVHPPAVAAAAGVDRPVPADPEAALAALAERRRAAADERAALDSDAFDHFPDEPTGPTLGDRGRPAAGVADTVLAETATDREGLRIGEVRVEGTPDGLALSATARYKPSVADAAADTDRWGYVETEPVAALRFPDPGEPTAALVEGFAPAAADRARGFAGFRTNATKTISPLDRVRALTLPDPAAAADAAARYRDARRRADELADRIAAIEDATDRIVYRLYGLDAADVAALED